jgi:membrane protease YdiL (CAAX protease family)
MKSAQSQSGAWLDVAIVVTVAVVIKTLMFDVAWKFAGPVSLACAMIVGTILLRRRGLTWAELGLRWPQGRWRWLWVPLQALLVFAMIVAVAMLAKEFISPIFPRLPTDQDRFEGIYQNLPYFLLWASIAVIHGGVFEEAIYRGFLITRLKTALGPGVIATAGSIILPAVFFGLRHGYYQGVYGALATGLAALGFGIMYLVFRRNLVALIIAHAGLDLIGMIGRYFIEPGA